VKWCYNHQGGCHAYLDGTTLEPLPKESDPWVVSHDIDQALGVNPYTGAFAGAGAGDGDYPPGVAIQVKSKRGKAPSREGRWRPIHKHWGNWHGKCSAQYGQFVGDEDGFLFAWSSRGMASKGPHELMVSRLKSNGKNRAGFPKKLSSDKKDKRDVTAVAFGTGYLVGYKERWGPSQFLKLDAEAAPVGDPEVSSAPFESAGGGLVLRAGDQVVWITDINQKDNSFRLARLDGPPPRPLPTPAPTAPTLSPTPAPTKPPTPSGSEFTVAGEGGCLKSRGRGKWLILNDVREECARFFYDAPFKLLRSADHRGNCLIANARKKKFKMVGCQIRDKRSNPAQQWKQSGDKWCPSSGGKKKKKRASKN